MPITTFPGGGENTTQKIRFITQLKGFANTSPDEANHESEGPPQTFPKPAATKRCARPPFSEKDVFSHADRDG
jgi:hypothetical protein